MSEVTIPLHALSWICVTTQFLGNYPFTVTIPKVFNTLFQNTSNYHYFRRLCTVTGFCDISGNHPLQKAGVKNFSTFLPHCIKTRLEFCSVAIHDAMPVISKYKQLNVFEMKKKQTRGRPSMHEYLHKEDCSYLKKSINQHIKKDRMRLSTKLAGKGKQEAGRWKQMPWMVCLIQSCAVYRLESNKLRIFKTRPFTNYDK